jgi:Xaa-Pro aminopeptidase
MDYSRRVGAARELLAERGLDALLVGEPATRRYLTGFGWREESATASAGWLLLTPDEGWFFTTFHYFATAEATIRHVEVVLAPSRLITTLVDGLNRLPGGSRVGFEGDWVSHNLFRALAEADTRGLQFQVADGLIEQLRETKDADELAVLRRAIAITDRAYGDVVATVRAGQSEREVAWRIERRLRELGADGMAFGPVVAAGPNAAIPHHEPTASPLRPGEPVWIDLGARVDGYCADLTRTFSLEFGTPEYLATWHLVHQAQERALAGLRPGVTGQEADALARECFRAAGRGDEFAHALGHGVGLAIHEGPRLGASNAAPLRTGMVVTVEPGLYRPAWGGVRIEDVALIEPAGAAVLSSAPKGPVLLGR